MKLFSNRSIAGSSDNVFPTIDRALVSDARGIQETSADLPLLEDTPPLSCDDCGLCCVGIGSPVLLYQSLPQVSGPHPHRPVGLPQELVEQIDAHFLGLARGAEPQTQCLWYDADAKRCRHYDWRPQICRDYELGGTACLLRREELQQSLHARKVKS